MHKAIPTLSFALASLAPGSLVLAQFDAVADGIVLERIGGEALPGLSATEIEPGDQLGAFFNGTLIGSFNFDSNSGAEFDITLTGDNPRTDAVEGPLVGEPVEFRFFDSSTNFVIENIRVETAGGERFNFTFQGADLNEIFNAEEPLPFPPELFIPSRNFNVRITEGGGPGTAPGSGGGNGGDGSGGAGFDVNGDGEVNRLDAATVIRAIAASNINVSSEVGDSLRARFVSAGELMAADVNGDGVVNARDVTAVIREISVGSRPSAAGLRPTNIAPQTDEGNGST